jgi:hypothetical protein
MKGKGRKGRTKGKRTKRKGRGERRGERRGNGKTKGKGERRGKSKKKIKLYQKKLNFFFAIPQSAAVISPVSRDKRDIEYAEINFFLNINFNIYIYILKLNSTVVRL